MIHRDVKTQMSYIEDAAQYRVTGEVPTMIMRHEVDWSFFTNGINVPVDRQDVLLNSLGYKFRRGDMRMATFIVNDKAYKVRFENFNQKRNSKSDTIQFRFAKSAFTRCVQELMPELFKCISEAKKSAGSTRKRVSTPKELTRYFTLYKLTQEDVFLIKIE